MQSGPKRHTARHTTPKAKLGRWKRHLLAVPYQLEAAGADKPVRITWNVDVISVIDPEAKQSSWSAAARALSSLENDGLVAVEPPRDRLKRNQRRAITSYRLTPAGRRRAKPGPDPQMPRVYVLGKRDATRRRRAIENEITRLTWETDFLPELIGRLKDVTPVGGPPTQRWQDAASGVERDVVIEAALLMRDLMYMRQVQASFGIASGQTPLHEMNHSQDE